MANEITTTQPIGVVAGLAATYGMDPDDFRKTLMDTVMPSGTTVKPAEFVAFCLVAKEHGLNPLLRQVYALPKRGGGIQTIVGVDGWASLINTHPRFNGMEFRDEIRDDKLISITCRMFHKDREHPVEATEYMAECIQYERDGKTIKDVWAKWPRRMLRHKAMIQAARYAFSFSGFIDPDEYDRFGATPGAHPQAIEAPPRAPALAAPAAEAPPRAPSASSNTPIAETFVETENALLRQAGAFDKVDEKTKDARTVDALAAQADEAIQDAELVDQDGDQPFDGKEMVASIADTLATTRTLADVEDVRNLYAEDYARLTGEQQQEVDELIGAATAKLEAGTEGQLPVEPATPFDEHIQEQQPASLKDPFEIPHTFKGGGHYTTWISDLCAACKKFEDRKTLLELWNETKVDRQELAASEQLVEVDLTRLRQHVSDKAAELKAMDPAAAPAAAQEPAAEPQRPAEPAAPVAGPDAIAAYETRLLVYLAAATNADQIARWWKAGEEERNLTGATRDQRMKWRDLQRKRREEIEEL